MKYSWIALSACLIFWGCGQNSSKQSSDFASLEQPATPETLESGGEPPQGSENLEVKPELIEIQKKVIKDGRINIKVSELEVTKIRVDSLVARHQAYYSNESLSNSDYESTYNLQIRIPSLNFEKFIEELESGEGEVMFKNIDARDVTEEFIDLETRLANKRDYLKKYNDLLKQAKSVKDILEIEEKSRVIEEEIESAEGRLKYLSNLVAFSTLDLSITKEKGYTYRARNKNDFGERLKYSLSSGWFGFVDFLLFLLKLWPFWILLALMIPLWKRFRAWRKSRRNRTS